MYIVTHYITRWNCCPLSHMHIISSTMNKNHVSEKESINKKMEVTIADKYTQFRAREAKVL